LICPNCGGSNTYKKGFRKLVRGIKQLFYCKDCKKKFSKRGTSGNPKILYFDIETSKMEIRKRTYRLGEQYISCDDIERDWFVLGWAAKWLCDDEIFSNAVTSKEAKNMNDERIVRNLWKYFDEADIIIGHNSDGFDIKRMNWRFIFYGLKPPSPYRTVDTLKVARRVTGASSKSMRFLAQELKLNGGKGDMTSDDWDACMDGDKKSLIKMRDYNIHDVVVGESIYMTLRSWDRQHPNMGLYYQTDELVCRNCGSTNVTIKGTYTTPAQTYKAWRCECGAVGRTDEKFLKGKKLLK